MAVEFIGGRGVARSRNAALASCDAEMLLFTDDDVRLLRDGLSTLIETFSDQPDLDVIVGKALEADGAPRKQYPDRPQLLTAFNSAHIGTVELAVRPRRIREHGVAFDTAFGAGTQNFVGDEYIFVTDCLKVGLRGQYIPTPFAIHAAASSGLDFGSAHSAVARARVFERVFSPAVVPAIKLAFLLRHRRRFSSARQAWRFARHFLAPPREDGSNAGED